MLMPPSDGADAVVRSVSTAPSIDMVSLPSKRASLPAILDNGAEDEEGEEEEERSTPRAAPTAPSEHASAPELPGSYSLDEAATSTDAVLTAPSESTVSPRAAIEAEDVKVDHFVRPSARQKKIPTLSKVSVVNASEDGGTNKYEQLKTRSSCRQSSSVDYRNVLGKTYINEYRIMKLLGEGSFGTVFRAVNERADHIPEESDVAIKVPPTGHRRAL